MVILLGENLDSITEVNVEPNSISHKIYKLRYYSNIFPLHCGHPCMGDGLATEWVPVDQKFQNLLTFCYTMGWFAPRATPQSYNYAGVECRH